MSKEVNSVEALKEDLKQKLSEVSIALSMTNYKAQDAINKAMDLKSNKKILAAWKANVKETLEIVAALSEHAKAAFTVAINSIDILTSKDPRNAVPETEEVTEGSSPEVVEEVGTEIQE